MQSTAGAAAAALGAAALFGLSAALQHQEARAVGTSAKPSLLLTLARRPLWVVGIVADTGAVGLQGLALTLGSVSLVQALLVAGLPLAAVLSAALGHRRLLRAEVVGLALCSAGLGLLGPALSATSVGRIPSRVDAVAWGVGLGAIVLALLALRSRPRYGPVCAGAAAGLVIGAGSVLLAVTAGRVGDWSVLFGTWALYAAIAVGLLGLLLAQIAFQTGDIGAPLATLSVLEPVTAVVLAVALLGERLPADTGHRVAAVVGTVLSFAGVLALSRVPHVPPSALVTEVPHEDQGPPAQP